MSKKDCRKWLKNPLVDPLSNKPVDDKEIFTKWAIATLSQLKPIEIYNLSQDMFNVLGLNDIFEPDLEYQNK